MLFSGIFRRLGHSAVGVGGAIVVLSGALPQPAQAVPGEQNTLPETCQAVAGATYVASEVAGIVLKPPLDFPPAVGAYAANWALRLCPPQIAAPPDKTGADGFEPDAVTATSDDPELENPAVNDPSCYASIPQVITKAEYSDFLGIESFRGDWGALGTPTVRHFNTDADVRLYAGAPEDDPDTAGDESLADERTTVRNASGQEILKLPVGKNGLTYRADTLVSVLDFPFIYIPGVPSESKPFKELVKSSGRLKALAIKGYEVFEGAVVEIAGEAGDYALDQAIGLNFRHSQLGVLDDVYNQDGQQVWVYDLIPPSLTARTDVSGLPANVQAVLSYDAERGVFYLEAIEPGGIRSGTAVDFLSRLIETHDHCNRAVTLTNDGGGSAFWPTGGSVNLTWTAADPGPSDASGNGNSVELTQHIEVRDSYPPVLLAPPSQVHELPAGQEGQGVQIDLGVPRVYDLATLEPSVSNDAAGDTFGLGLTEVHWTASDGTNTSEAVQLINVKAYGTNTPPVADAQSVSTRSFEDTEIVLSGSDADFHPSVGRYDPLTFGIVDNPDHGHFVAPLLPYFIDDYRLEASALKFTGDTKQEDPDQYCHVRGGSDPNAWQIAYPYDAEWMAVDDDGTTMVYDHGSAFCDNDNYLNTAPRLVIFDANHDLEAYVETGSGSTVSDIFWDRDTDRIYVAHVDNDGDDWVAVYAPDLTQIARYNLGSGASADWQVEKPVAVTVDRRDILYVANTSLVNAYRQVDGVFDVDASTVFLGRAWTSADAREIQSLAADSAGNLYIGEPDRIVKLAPAELSGGAIFIPGQLAGWLGYCSSNLTGDYACDTPNQRSLGFACTDALCGPGGVHYGSAPGQFMQAEGIAVDPHDVLYVSDYGNSRVQRFTSDGTFGGEAKSTGVGYGFLLGDFGQPQDIEVNSDHFYILNRDAKLLHVFATTPLTPVDDAHAKVTYRSDDNFVGMDAFRFAVTDGFDSAEADVTIDVSRNFRPPEVPDSGLAYTAPAAQEDQAVTFTVPATDPDGDLDTLTLQIVRPPAHGTITTDGVNVTYTPDANYAGPDDFAYGVYDGRDTSEQTGQVSIDIDPIEDAPAIETETERTASVGFKLAHRLDVFDPDEDEQLLVAIDWGDGTQTDEGHFELDGMPVPADEARNEDGTIRDDVETTGPILSVDPTGRGVLMADHVYTAAGTYQATACVYDRVELDAATQVKSLTSASQKVCAATAVTVAAAAELVLDTAPPGDDQSPGAPVEFAVTLRNQAFDLDAADPRFPQLPAKGTDIVGLELDGEVGAGLSLLGVDAPGGVCTTSGAELSCTFAALPYGAEEALTVHAQVADTAAGRAVLGLSLEGRWVGMLQEAAGGATFEVASSGAAPTLTEISPATGEPAGFTEVTLTGGNFEAGSTVLFGGRPGTKTRTIDSGTMTVLAPAASAGTVDVTIVNPDGQQAALSGAWTYQAAATSPGPTPPSSGPDPTPPSGSTSGGGGGGGGGAGALELLLLALCLLPALRLGRRNTRRSR